MAKGKKTGGRRTGTPNRFSMALKDVILGALSDAGGRSWLLQQADKNPVAFMQFVGVPLQVKDGGSEPVGPRPVFSRPYPLTNDEWPEAREAVATAQAR